MSKSRTTMLQPSSRFPFSPLTDAAAHSREQMVLEQIELRVIEPPVWPYTELLADAVGEYADLLRSTDVRCGHERGGWPA